MSCEQIDEENEEEKCEEENHQMDFEDDLKEIAQTETESSALSAAAKAQE